MEIGEGPLYAGLRLLHRHPLADSGFTLQYPVKVFVHRMHHTELLYGSNFECKPPYNTACAVEVLLWLHDCSSDIIHADSAQPKKVLLFTSAPSR